MGDEGGKLRSGRKFKEERKIRKPENFIKHPCVLEPMPILKMRHMSLSAVSAMNAGQCKDSQALFEQPSLALEKQNSVAHSPG